MDAENINQIFENSTSIKITNSESLCIKLYPDERFMKIGNILRHLYADECANQKKHLLFQKLSSEIMGIIFWSHLIWSMYKQKTNNQFLTSTWPFGCNLEMQNTF
eukprot:370606_1